MAEQKNRNPQPQAAKPITKPSTESKRPVGDVLGLVDSLLGITCVLGEWQKRVYVPGGNRMQSTQIDGPDRWEVTSRDGVESEGEWLVRPGIYLTHTINQHGFELGQSIKLQSDRDISDIMRARKPKQDLLDSKYEILGFTQVVLDTEGKEGAVEKEILEAKKVEVEAKSAITKLEAEIAPMNAEIKMLEERKAEAIKSMALRREIVWWFAPDLSDGELLATPAGELDA